MAHINIHLICSQNPYHTHIQSKFIDSKVKPLESMAKKRGIHETKAKTARIHGKKCGIQAIFISRMFWLVSVHEQTGLGLILWQTPVTVFSH